MHLHVNNYKIIHLLKHKSKLCSQDGRFRVLLKCKSVCPTHVRPNGTKAPESGTEKDVLRCHERRQVAHILRTPKAFTKALHRKGEGGV